MSQLPKNLKSVSGLMVGGQWQDIQADTLEQKDGWLSYRQGGTQEHLSFYIRPDKVEGYRDNHKARKALVDAELAVIDATGSDLALLKEQQANALARAVGGEGDAIGSDDSKRAAAAKAASGRAEAMAGSPPPVPDSPDASYGTDGPATMRRGPGPTEEQHLATAEASSKAAQATAKLKHEEDEKAAQAREDKEKEEKADEKKHGHQPGKKH